MNAYSRTAHQLAAALTGKTYTAQQVVVVSKSPTCRRFVVLVIADGEEQGRYFDCGERSLSLLQTGMSTDDLELEEVDSPDAGEGDLLNDYAHSDDWPRVYRAGRTA